MIIIAVRFPVGYLVSYDIAHDVFNIFVLHEVVEDNLNELAIAWCLSMVNGIPLINNMKSYNYKLFRIIKVTIKLVLMV